MVVGGATADRVAQLLGHEPVARRPPGLIEGSADVVQGRDEIARVADLMNAKYGGITVEFLAAHDDFTGSPTRRLLD